MSPDIAAQATVHAESVSESTLADLLEDPTTLAAAPDMPTALIKPFAGKGSAVEDAWGVGAVGADVSRYDGAGVKVAILDTGIDATHPCFKGVNIVQRDFTGAGNGDVAGHGTHCAGTILGRDVSGRIGIACGVRDAYIGKILDDVGRGTALMVTRGIRWAADQGANIISLSLGIDTPGFVKKLIDGGWPPKLAAARGLDGYRRNIRLFDRQISLLVAEAGHGQEVLVVAASGNESERAANPNFRIPASLPAAAEGVLSVGALGRSAAGLTVANFSNSLPTVSAPGVDIRSAWPGGGFETLSGTSMACPHVAGVAALWWQSLGSAATAEMVRIRLLGATIMSDLAPGYDHTDVGSGLVRAP
jgi:subtilisin family serine protease